VKVHQRLGDLIGNEILMLSLSIDPAVDTPERLNEYWQTFGSRPGWFYLTGDYDEIDYLRRQLGVYDLDPVIDANKAEHSGIITFGNDTIDRWSALPALMDARGIVETILRTTQGRSRPRLRAVNVPSSYVARGVIREILDEPDRLIIEHEDIPDLMPAMTMTFELDMDLRPQGAEGLEPGQQIDFHIRQDGGSFWIYDIE